MNDDVERNLRREKANFDQGLAAGGFGCITIVSSVIIGVFLGGWAGYNLYGTSEDTFYGMNVCSIAGAIIVPLLVFPVTNFMARKVIAKRLAAR